MDFDPSSLKGQPRRWFIGPMALGVFLIFFGLLCWYQPRILLFLICFPMIAGGVGLVLFGLDLWRGVPRWRERVQTIHLRVWPRDGEDR